MVHKITEKNRYTSPLILDLDKMMKDNGPNPHLLFSNSRDFCMLKEKFNFSIINDEYLQIKDKDMDNYIVSIFRLSEIIGVYR